MNEQQKEYLSNLRHAASFNQWQECRDSLEKLLPDLQPPNSIKLIVRYLRRFLVDLRNYYPQDEKIVASFEALDAVTSFDVLGTRADEVYRLLESRVSNPGINNFRAALKLLARPHEWRYPPNSHPETVLSVLSNILIAIPDLDWGTQNTDLWHRAFWHETKEDFFIYARYFVTDLNVIQMNKSLWLEVANDIETALQEGG